MRLESMDAYRQLIEIRRPGVAKSPEMMSTKEKEEAIIQMWLSNLHSEHSRESYAYAFQAFQAWIPKFLCEVDTRDLMIFRDNIKGADGTRRLRYTIIQSLFTFAFDIGYLTFNPARAVKPPRKTWDLGKKILPEEKVIEMIQTETRPRRLAVLKLLYGTGMRASELTALTWKNFRVGHKKPDKFAGYVDIKNGKGGKRRTVSVTHSIARELFRIRPKPKKGESIVNPDLPIFAGKSGEPISRITVFRYIKEAGLRVGMQGVSPHWLRHSFATHVLQHGGDLNMIREDLGHASISTTSGYLHANPDDGGGGLLDFGEEHVIMAVPKREYAKGKYQWCIIDEISGDRVTERTFHYKRDAVEACEKLNRAAILGAAAEEEAQNAE